MQTGSKTHFDIHVGVVRKLPNSGTSRCGSHNRQLEEARRAQNRSRIPNQVVGTNRIVNIDGRGGGKDWCWLFWYPGGRSAGTESPSRI